MFIQKFNVFSMNFSLLLQVFMLVIFTLFNRNGIEILNVVLPKS